MVTSNTTEERVIGEDASVKFRGNTKRATRKIQSLWYVTQNITGTEQGPSDLSVGCLLTVECALFPR